MLNSSLIKKILTYCNDKNYTLSTQPGEINIIYIEGLNSDGSLNSDSPNYFNDIRLVLRFQEPYIAGIWQASTEPGSYYTSNPMNSKGAARIKFGQYVAWRVGTHGNSEPHEALIQVEPVTVHRDFNKDFKRTGDKLDTGLFGINQHWGYDQVFNNIGRASAGCLVGRTRDGHREFMKLIKSDIRYKQDSDYVFDTIIIAGDDLLKTTE